MYATHYHRPATLNDAETLLAHRDDPQILAGGQTLIPTLKQRLAAPTDLIDLRHIPDLSFIRDMSDRIEIGAMTLHREVAASSIVRQFLPGLAFLAGKIGDPLIRNMGTLGGSIANNDPAADYPAGLLGLGATVHTNKRALHADDFFKDLFETALQDTEIVTSVSFPKPAFCGYRKFANPISRYALVGVFLAKFGDAGVRIAVTGAGSNGVFRLIEAEERLTGTFSIKALEDFAPSPDNLMSDLHGQADYRAHLIKSLTQKLVCAAR
ncbi:FAD binding domain-containing protein [Sneathiella sp.]|jgi:carbon-monoxide dehydrogenase medium subunit|uniref:FAD binding domain-containing protein n=1 Tax=Sneathiella sp. TaxID=1964365 RepID=UPI0039E62C5C